MFRQFPEGDDAAAEAGEDFEWRDEFVVGPFVSVVFGTGLGVHVGISFVDGFLFGKTIEGDSAIEFTVAAVFAFF